MNKLAQGCLGFVLMMFISCAGIVYMIHHNVANRTDDRHIQNNSIQNTSIQKYHGPMQELLDLLGEPKSVDRDRRIRQWVKRNPKLAEEVTNNYAKMIHED